MDSNKQTTPAECKEKPAQNTMTTADLLIKCLEMEGVSYIFGIPGEENLSVIEALRNSSIRFITTDRKSVV